MNCTNCGASLAGDAKFCPNCGKAVVNDSSISNKSRLITALLCWFFGGLGIHRFYVGRTGSAIAMIFTLGGLGVWTVVDLVFILCGDFKDGQKRKIKTWLD